MSGSVATLPALNVSIIEVWMPPSSGDVATCTLWSNLEDKSSKTGESLNLASMTFFDVRNS